MRPLLKPALRQLWRDPTTLQLGIDPRHAVVLGGLSREGAAVLALADGTRDWAHVVDEARSCGVSAADAHALLLLLRDSGALDDADADPAGLSGDERARLAPDLGSLSLLAPGAGAALSIMSERRSAAVLVAGTGRVGSHLAALLAAAGVGRLLLRDDSPGSESDAIPGGCPAGPWRAPRVVTAAGEVARCGDADVDAAVHAPDDTDLAAVDLAVLAPDSYRSPDLSVLAMLADTGTPYLMTGVRETVGVVGPLVRPGRSSCPRCHDLARADRDPAWPALAMQLAAAHARGGEACDVVLASAVAAITAGQVLAVLGGPPPALCADATLELRLPEWSLRRRVWAAHPDCQCGAAAGASDSRIPSFGARVAVDR
jgi:hypothetical protein